MFKLDVVFCTHDHADRSPELVPALRAQDCSVSIEILAVNNNSKDNTLAILENLATQPGAPLRFVTETAQGYSLHSRSLLHHDLTKLETPTLERDLCDSRLDRRHHRLGASVFCYPYGRHNEAVRNAAQRVGFTTAFSVESGFNRPGRTPIKSADWMYSETIPQHAAAQDLSWNQ